MKIPEITDFTKQEPPEQDLDAYQAWTSFKGLDRDAAFEKFCSHPEFFAEDFFWMGSGAFCYYFPVLDRYMREVEVVQNGFDGEAESIGRSLGHQFQLDSSALSSVRVQAEALCDFVIDGLSRLPEGSTFQPVNEILDTWKEAKSYLVTTR